MLLATLSRAEKHPMHISICDIYYNDSNNTLEISQKVFLDDLELALEKNNIYPYKITDSLTANLHQSISKYFNQNLKIVIDQKSYKINYVGAEIEEDAVWCYFEIIDVSFFKKIKLFNGVFLDIYDDQRNITNLKMKGYNSSCLFHKENKSHIFSLD